MKWVLVKVVCADCGGDITLTFFDKKPTDEEYKRLTAVPFCASWKLEEIPSGT